ncbi:N-(5'-phosphoribosyl)anthranilate isomerase [Clostridia bacterium]|nr:N-(5'-phosphoribosyl)anthranilate isomerase [Clostridia bacterium]
MTKIKICGLFRNQDIEYVNEAKPDFIGFVFAESRRRITPAQAESFRKNLRGGIVPIGVFVNADTRDIAALYRNGIIGIAQLHGGEDAAYIDRLKALCGVPVVKMVKPPDAVPNAGADYLLFDSGNGSGKTFDWRLLPRANKPYFLAGGIGLDNIEDALKLSPFAIDVSSGAETDGVKDREKILRLAKICRRAY